MSREDIYSRQLIRELEEHLDDEITEFFERTKEQYDYRVKTLEKLVKYTLEECLEGNTSKEALCKIYDSEIRNRRRTKKRMFDQFKDGIEQSFGMNAGDQYTAMLKKMLLEQKLPELEQWAKDSGSYFVVFEMLEKVKTPNKIFRLLVSDTLLCILKYLNQEYDGAIDNYFLKMPQYLLGIPLFAPKKVRLDMTLNEECKLVETHEYSAGVLETSANLSEEEFSETRDHLAAVEVSKKLSVMDQNDLRFLYTSIQYLDEDFVKTRKARVKRSVLVRLLHERPGKKHYEAMIKHCHNLSKYNFSIFSTEGKKMMSFNLIDTVETQEDSEDVVFTYGSMLYESILANELTRIKSSNLAKLELNLSSVLFQSLFNERMVLSIEAGDGEIVHSKEYTFSFFSNNVRFPKQSKKKNLDLIEESLQEFVRKKIVVHSYERNSHGFRISFYPLTAEERADLTFNKQRIS